MQYRNKGNFSEETEVAGKSECRREKDKYSGKAKRPQVLTRIYVEHGNDHLPLESPGYQC